MLAKVAETDDARFLKADTGRGRPRRKGQPQPGSLNPDRKVSHQPNRVFELVRSIFRWAVGEDLIDHDPMAGMKPPVEVDSARDRSLSEVELPSFWRALDAAAIEHRHVIFAKPHLHLSPVRTGTKSSSI